MSSVPQANECRLPVKNWVSSAFCRSESWIPILTGIPRTVNSTSFETPLARTGSLIVPSDIAALLVKAMSRTGPPYISSLPIPILDRVLRKMRST
ncbi:unnamed protein product [Cochlearia groenlandica]